MDVYVARQPIFGKEQAVYGYELLFRDSLINTMPDVDADTATTQLLSNSYFAMGFDKMIGESKAFVNFTRNLLIRQIPLMFPETKTVVEIFYGVAADVELVDACKALKAKGYLIALDGFENREETNPLVALADIVKIDFRTTPMDEMDRHIRSFSGSHIHLLAEKVETYDEFYTAVELGFDYYQGYFFCKPEIVKGKEISSSQLTILELMAEANRTDINFDKINAVIERDVAVSYKLLHYINSAFYKRVNEIATVKQALVLLGEKEVRRFISMIALTQLITDKPDELVNLSFVRAKFLELMGGATGSPDRASELFTLGLFSLIDAILDQSIADIMDRLPLSQTIRDALVERTGAFSPFLELAVGYERGDWDRCAELSTRLSLDPKQLPSIYFDACHWGTSMN